MTEEEFKKNAKTIPIDIEKEEKAAIDYFKYKVLPTTNGTAFESKEEHYTKMVLNVIEKLQKENEELRHSYDIATTKTEELKKKLGLKQFDVNVVYSDYLEKLREFKSNSVPKNKIREKIEPKLNKLKEEMNKEFDMYGKSSEYLNLDEQYNFLYEIKELLGGK